MAVAHFHFQLFRLHSRAVLQLPLRSDWAVVDTARRKFRWPVIKTRLGVKSVPVISRLGSAATARIVSDLRAQNIGIWGWLYFGHPGWSDSALLSRLRLEAHSGPFVSNATLRPRDQRLGFVGIIS